jgi:hypothetical protein
MRVPIISLCDSVSINDGKLTMNGIFDRLFAKVTPCVHPMCAVAGHIHFEVTEVGKHPFKFVFLDEDGKSLLSIVNQMDVKEVPDGGSFITVPFVFNLNGLPLPHYGDYEAQLLLDNQTIAAAPLLVRPIPGQSPAT